MFRMKTVVYWTVFAMLYTGGCSRVDSATTQVNVVPVQGEGPRAIRRNTKGFDAPVPGLPSKSSQ
jgi:hypothetical protein